MSRCTRDETTCSRTFSPVAIAANHPKATAFVLVAGVVGIGLGYRYLDVRKWVANLSRGAKKADDDQPHDDE